MSGDDGRADLTYQRRRGRRPDRPKITPEGLPKIVIVTLGGSSTLRIPFSSLSLLLLRHQAQGI